MYPRARPGAARESAIAAFQQDLHAGLTRAGYPAAADPAQVDKVKVIGILCIFGLLATMVYGPLAAPLVELFPARIRYRSLSLPYHLGNGCRSEERRARKEYVSTCRSLWATFHS